MDMEVALHRLGVRDETLSPDEKQFLDENGYLPLPGVMTPDQVRAFTQRLEELTAEEGEDAGKEVHQEEGSIRLSDLINKDPLFDYCYTQPRLLAAVRHILTSDFKVHSLNSRFALPGQGLQAFHMDWGSDDPEDWLKLKSHHYFVANSLWILSDFSEETGGTRVVPGSHQWAKKPTDLMNDPKQGYPGQMIVTANAGTVVVFNGHTWHSGTLNRSNSPRRVMHMAFVRRHLPQQTDQKAHLRPATAARLTPERRLLLDV